MKALEQYLHHLSRERQVFTRFIQRMLPRRRLWAFVKEVTTSTVVGEDGQHEHKEDAVLLSYNKNPHTITTTRIGAYRPGMKVEVEEFYRQANPHIQVRFAS